jgi:hypothetical protein
MIDILLTVVWFWLKGTLFLFLTTFLLYIAIMFIKEKQDVLYAGPGIVRWICFFFLFLGLVSDTALNWWSMTVFYLEIPKEFLTTARVVRHLKTGSGWRYTQSVYWCHYWLTPFDPNHCKY